MIIEKVSATTHPQPVTVEHLPGGLRRVVLSKDVREAETEEGVIVEYSEAVFELPEGRSDDPEDIEAVFAAWWDYAAEDHIPPTLEEKVDLLFDVMFGEE